MGKLPCKTLTSIARTSHSSQTSEWVTSHCYQQSPSTSSPSCYSLGTQTGRTGTDPVTESHPLDSPLPTPYHSRGREANFVTLGWPCLASTHWTCVCISFLSLSYSTETGVVIKRQPWWWVTFYLWVCDTFKLLRVPIVWQILSKILELSSRGSRKADGGRNWNLLSL